MDIRDVLSALRGGWWLVVGGVLVGLTATVALLLLVPARYSATAEVTVAPVSWSGAQTQYEGTLLPEQRAPSYAAVLTSDEVTAAVVRDLGLPTTPRELSRQLRVVVVPGTSVLQVTAVEPTAGRAVDVLTALQREFSDRLAADETRSPTGMPLVRVLTVQSPHPDPQPAAPQTDRDLALAASVGALCGLVAATLRYARRRPVRSRDELSFLTGIPVLDLSADREPFARWQPPAVVAVLAAGPEAPTSPVAIALAATLEARGATVRLRSGDLAGTAPRDTRPRALLRSGHDGGWVPGEHVVVDLGDRLPAAEAATGDDGGCVVVGRWGVTSAARLRSLQHDLRAQGRQLRAVAMLPTRRTSAVRHARARRYSADVERGGRSTAAEALRPAPVGGRHV